LVRSAIPSQRLLSHFPLHPLIRTHLRRQIDGIERRPAEEQVEQRKSDVRDRRNQGRKGKEEGKEHWIPDVLYFERTEVKKYSLAGVHWLRRYRELSKNFRRSWLTPHELHLLRRVSTPTIDVNDNIIGRLREANYRGERLQLRAKEDVVQI